ncbi:hypothetical protein Ga0123461_2287 [Mariprofundus aestuarium]|uniref:Uncharacterized protein n=1 Tax=Mariprofundus aestuarium TaxID=1921086 RepID=A0A2K8L392_MARES|nr:hypothetical protein [Mariprofundus aestuarium]ATX80689.1 hypothetical protein Ga0123461_2287 [Mariprofundus aestuarium]
MQAVSSIAFAPPVASTPLKGKQVLPKSVPVQQLAPPKESDKPSGLWESDKFSFRDFIDMINPLQHLPVVSTIYRKLTGDEIGDGPRMVGGAIFGGVLGSWISGLASAVANVFSSRTTGKDVGDHVLELAQSATEANSGSGTQAATVNSPSVALMHPVGIQSPDLRKVDAALSVPELTNVQETRAAPVAQAVAEVARSASQREHRQMLAAIGQYKQQMIVDDLTQETHIWA